MPEATELPVANPAAELPLRDGTPGQASLSVRLVTLIAIVIPLLGAIAAPFFLWGWGFRWTDLGLLLGMYVLTALGITVGFHRLFVHHSFETYTWMKFVWAVLGSMAVQGPAVVNQAAETARPLMDARKHQLSASIPVNPLWVRADPARLEQVVVNLLNNAAKFTDPGGLIRMSVGQEGALAVIRVRDNGIGIAPAQLSGVFELFTQVDGSANRSFGGLGIGLALARNLVELHEGKLQGSSAGLGQGCEFTVQLPMLLDPLKREAKTVLEPGPARGRSLRLLLVEDNVDSGDSLSLLLRLYGHEVQVARTGPAALELASTTRADVVLLDIGLPGMDGYEVAGRLRQMPEYKGVVMCALTGYTPSEADCRRQEQAGFDHYYVKPVEPETLLELFKTIEPAAS